MKPITWTVEENGNGGGNSELQYYLRDNIAIGKEPESGESCLIITAKKQNYKAKTCTSGRLNTYDKMSFRYGKLEARIKLPKTANGLWPAFWMLGADYSSVGWPASGEIDIMEMGAIAGIQGNVQERFFNGACHWGANWDGRTTYDEHVTAPYSLQDDFHLYTLIWDKEALRMYLDMDKYPDNPPYLELAIDKYDTPNSPGHFFNKQFYVVFNMAIGGNFTGIHSILNVSALNSANNFEANMYVDYIRLYQKGEEGEELTLYTPTGLTTTSDGEKSFTIQHDMESGWLTVRGKEIPHSIILYDLLGRKVAESWETENVDLSFLSSDVYLVKIQTRTGGTETYKVKI